MKGNITYDLYSKEITHVQEETLITTNIDNTIQKKVINFKYT